MGKKDGIGTINYRSRYYRPSLLKISKAAFENEIALSKKIAPNMYARTLSIGRIGRDKVYNTYVAFSAANGECYIFEVPTNKDGKIEDNVIAERLLDAESGDRQGKVRNLFVDIGIDAKEVSTPDKLADSYRWYLHPNESDIKNMDDSNSQIVAVLGKNEGAGFTGKRTLLISGGTQSDRDQIAFDVTKNFTIREKQILAGCLIVIEPTTRYAGCFSGYSDANGKPIGVPKIVIGTRYTKDSGVIIHEAIHALREFDVKRIPAMRAVKNYVGRDADLEESLTEAETVARQNPFTKHSSDAGYYHFIKVPDKSKKEVIISDRITLTSPKDGQDFAISGKKGKKAQTMVIKHYPSTYMAHFKLEDKRTEAIDTYYQVDNRKGGIVTGVGTKTNLQFYTPHPDINTDKEMDKAIRSLPANSIEWVDGKKHIIKKIKKNKKHHSTDQIKGLN